MYKLNLKKKYAKLYFVYCYSHCLNLVLGDFIRRDIRVIFEYSGWIHLIYNSVEGSYVRHAIYEQIVNSTNAKLKTLIMFIEQESAHNVNVDDVIVQFKTLTPKERSIKLWIAIF